MPDKMLSMAALTLMREDPRHAWGFRLAGGQDVGQPLTVNLISGGSIADYRGLRKGDKVLQIGRERTIDMTHEDALDTISRCGNRLDLVLLRQQSESMKIEEVEKSGRVKAIVHNQYNSPMNLYSNENIADTLVKQAQVLTNGKVKPESNNNMSSPTLMRSEVYRMVQEENRRDSPPGYRISSPTAVKTPPPPPPKPGSAHQVSSTKTQLQDQRNYQYSSHYHQQEHQRQTQPAPQHEYRPVRQSNPTTSSQISSPPLTKVQPRTEYNQEEKRTMTDQAQVKYVTYSTPPPSYSINPQSHGHGGSTHWTAPPPGAHRKPVWPPPKNDQSNNTSTQSVKWGGSSRESKRFVWPPPKGVFIEEDEEDEGQYHQNHQHNQRQIIYQQVAAADAGQPRASKTPRKPSRLAAQAWEPYMGQHEEEGLYCVRGPSKRIRSAREVYQHASNSTPLPPTYRAPPGTQHVIFEYE